MRFDDERRAFGLEMSREAPNKYNTGMEPGTESLQGLSRTCGKQAVRTA